MHPLYTASATATGDGRDGHVRSSDGVLDQVAPTGVVGLRVLVEAATTGSVFDGGAAC